MKTNYKIFKPMVLIITLLTSILVAHSVLAFQLCNPTIPYAGKVVQSCKDNYTLSGNVYWKGRMVTKVVNAGPISKLGWNYWSDTRYCGGTPVALYPYGSSYSLNSSYRSSTSASHPVGSCAGGQVNQANVYGTHYWEQVGYSGITDTWSYWRNLP